MAVIKRTLLACVLVERCSGLVVSRGSRTARRPPRAQQTLEVEEEQETAEVTSVSEVSSEPLYESRLDKNNILKMSSSSKSSSSDSQQRRDELFRASSLHAAAAAAPRRFDPLADHRAVDFLSEAEIKHGRFAMLGFIAWPGAELVTGRPFEIPSSAGLTLLVAFVAAVEMRALFLSAMDTAGLSAEKRMPGDLGFDPLGMLPVEKYGRLRMRHSETEHGRLAMVALVGMAAAEHLHGDAIVNLTPFFFQPPWA